MTSPRDTVTDKRVDFFYKFVQPILTTLTSLGIVTVLTMVVQNDRNQAVMQVKLESIQKQMDIMQSQIKDRYTEDDAGSDFELRDQLIRTLTKEDERLEKRIEKLEQLQN